ncbi:phage tail protein [Bradyrhizobium sp. USDA 4529]
MDYGNNASNQPPGAAVEWMVESIAFNNFFSMQVAYPFTLVVTAGATPSVEPMRRYSYNSGGAVAWTPWESMSPIPVGTTIWVNGTATMPGFLKENGSLVPRASYPRLWEYALASGYLVTEGQWSANSGAFSSGDLATTFRLPDSRGEFIRGWDDGRGVDAGRTIGSHQSDMIIDQNHNYAYYSGNVHQEGTNQATVQTLLSIGATGGVNGGLAGNETRPRNNAKLALIKY